METLEQCVKSVQSQQKRHKVWTDCSRFFKHCSSVSIVDFKQVNGWSVG